MLLLRTMLFLAQDSAPTSTPAEGSAKPIRAWESWDLHDSVRLITFIGLLIAATIVLGFVLTYLKRRMAVTESAMAGTGSLMDELRRLRKEGILSEAEYEASRRAATAKLRDSMNASGTTRAHGQERAAPQRSNYGAKVPRPETNPLEDERPPDGLQARPGFDLTGEPLPPREDENKSA